MPKGIAKQKLACMNLVWLQINEISLFVKNIIHKRPLWWLVAFEDLMSEPSESSKKLIPKIYNTL